MSSLGELLDDRARILARYTARPESGKEIPGYLARLEDAVIRLDLENARLTIQQNHGTEVCPRCGDAMGDVPAATCPCTSTRFDREGVCVVADCEHTEDHHEGGRCDVEVRRG